MILTSANYTDSIRSESNREDVELDVWSIVSLGIGVTGIIYAVFTNRRGEKKQKELVAKYDREREIDQQLYEEEKIAHY